MRSLKLVAMSCLREFFPAGHTKVQKSVFGGTRSLRADKTVITGWQDRVLIYGFWLAGTGSGGSLKIKDWRRGRKVEAGSWWGGWRVGVLRWSLE